MRRLCFGFIVSLAIATTSVSAASRNEASLVLVPPTAAAPSSSWPQVGDSVAFAAVYPKSLDKYGVGIHVSCFQDGNLVYSEAHLNTATFVLGGSGSPWTVNGGSAYCVADLYYWSQNAFHWLAGTQFTTAG